MSCVPGLMMGLTCGEVRRSAGWLRLSGNRGGLLKRLVSALRKAEAQRAAYWQRDHPLAGDVEVDAASLRKFKSGGGWSG
eukprot:Skav202936  [mRNA]  locus=scaffold422:129503:130410:+ [translate_table: standard]